MNEHPPNGPQRRPPAGLGRWHVFACLLLVVAGQTSLRSAEALADASTKAVLRLGFSSSLFAGVNENDVKAAMKVWAQGMLMEHGVAVTAEPKVLNGGEEIASGVRNKLVDTLTMSAEEYWSLGGERMSTNAILGVGAGSVSEEYVVLVHRDSNIGRIEDLRGRSLVFFQSPRTSLAPTWFETLLLKSGLGQSRQFCGRITQGTKLSQAVLPVFFRQADACVVTRRGFQTMVELNPQVGQRLKTLVSSPAMVPVVFLFRADYTDPVRDQIFAEVGKVHSSAGGQQVLTLFQCEDLVIRPVSALDSALELLATHARLSEAANHAAEPTHASIPLANGATGKP